MGRGTSKLEQEGAQASRLDPTTLLQGAKSPRASKSSSSSSPPSARPSSRTSAKVLPEFVAAAQRVSQQLSRERLELSQDAPPIKEFSIFGGTSASDIDEVMRLAGQDVRARRAMGAMVGMAVSDSVGGNFEFVPVETEGSSFDFRTLKVVGELNKFELKPGQWSDDTSMGLCLADSLLVLGGYDGCDIRVRIWNWWNRGYNNTFRLDEERSESVGLGGNVKISLLALLGEPRTQPRFVSFGEDSGNGSVIRLAPVPIFFHTDIDLAMRVSAESSYTTHPGHVASDACAFLGFLLARGLAREERRREKARQFLDEAAAAYLARPEVEDQPLLARLLRSSEPAGSKERCWNWRDPKGPYILETLAARGNRYNGFKFESDYFGSYSMDGLATALHSVYHTHSFMEALGRCVNFLGDADSTGAICGQIAGVFYGVDAIDERLVARLRRWDGGEIALRAALLYALGTQLTEEEMQRARRKSARALAWDERGAPPEEEDLEDSGFSPRPSMLQEELVQVVHPPLPPAAPPEARAQAGQAAPAPLELEPSGQTPLPAMLQEELEQSGLTPMPGMLQMDTEQSGETSLPEMLQVDSQPPLPLVEAHSASPHQDVGLGPEAPPAEKGLDLRGRLAVPPPPLPSD
eukprot:CAMPEP_0177185978 /NCGR_PEP_ID=MMETSP0367-20130122/18394_1 /TAXON_ID=447022 ORGANISM="Scrippsiella hangoei-like, Strain SHHI-4" /NCGR_SAMPLE_ID=MMETSP0367 /ASSEMBLY_ACC=CAM_ASM_000362 /LENGTH=635 /DNA_ID=CAMNT_0018633227 /DNA_START=56 /DNA_END=1960 /DNA_ORIENTATION=+